MSKKSAVIFALMLLFPLACLANEDDIAMQVDDASLNDDAISIYATSCEKIKPNEAKSTARVRVTDRASFLAVRNVTNLGDVQKNLDEHDFNVLIYNIVDNNVEDLAIRTTKQTNEEICVEVTGYIQEQNILGAIEKLKNTKNENEEDTQNFETEDFEAKEELEVAQEVEQKMETAPAPKEDAQDETEEKKSFIYVSPTKFYNNTSSNTYAQVLVEQVKHINNFHITDKKTLADYVINSQVLRAKVDPINSNTNRLQMVVSVEVEFVDGNSSTTEHQNRFVLFSTEENEQEVAFKLMKKLFEKAGEQILNKIDVVERKKNRGNSSSLPSIITPSK